MLVRILYWYTNWYTYLVFSSLASTLFLVFMLISNIEQLNVIGQVTLKVKDLVQILQPSLAFPPLSAFPWWSHLFCFRIIVDETIILVLCYLWDTNPSLMFVNSEFMTWLTMYWKDRTKRAEQPGFVMRWKLNMMLLWFYMTVNYVAVTLFQGSYQPFSFQLSSWIAIWKGVINS